MAKQWLQSSSIAVLIYDMPMQSFNQFRCNDESYQCYRKKYVNKITSSLIDVYI